MKKLLILFIVIICNYKSYSQSQRLILFEEFTQASCGPCQYINPPLNDMLNLYHDQVVSIKYQTYFPGVDPMNDHNPQQVADREDYYNVNGVPNGKLDGGIAFSGVPDMLNPYHIINRSSVPSPFSINTSFSISPGNDTIYCSANIVASQQVNGNLKAHMVVIERDIYFYNSPGQNNETHFEGVMKRMLPSSSGTLLQSSWQTGENFQINESWKLSNIYDINQLALVVFVQDENTKEILQAGYARPHINNDVDILSLSNIPSLQCTGNTIQPRVKIRNKSANVLNSFTIETFANNILMQSIAINSALNPDKDSSITLPPITLSNGTYELNFKITSPNGATDDIPLNDTLLAYCSLNSDPSVFNFTADFQVAGTFPSGSGPFNPDADSYTWNYTTIGNNNQGSVMMPMYSSEISHVDYFYLPSLNLVNLSPENLTFDVAYARYNVTIRPTTS